MTEAETVLEQQQETQINKMVMKGFKSFADRTEVVFGDDFNCILGPNGSGKSNILDALTFVLGKAGSKALRAEKTANLIYNGGKNNKPAKQGAVHIFFDNESGVFPLEADEVKISRVVKQDGTSDYLIDDEVRTRTEVTDLLAHARITPDGYNIILQGDIVRLVEMSTTERREIIEEISGINIYEEKKNKATRELERVEEQLNEADIVLKERKTYLEELKQERDQALKFQELDEKIKRNKATILTRKIDKKEGELEKVEEKIAKHDEKIDEVQAEIDERKQDILEKKEELAEVSREVESKGEKEQVALMKEVEQLRVDLALKEQRQETVAQELERIEKRREDLLASKEDVEEKISRLEKEVTAAQKKIESREKDKEQLNEKIDEVREEHDLESAADLDDEVEALEDDIEDKQEEIQDLREKQQELLRDKDKLEYKIETLDEKIQKVLEAQKENEEQLAELKTKKSELKVVEDELDEALDRASEIAPELQTAKGKLETRREELSKLKARQTRIQEKVAGSTAVKKILELAENNPKIHGTVAELGKVSEEFSLALEIAAGGRVRSIVVEDDKTAQECIEYLKKNRYGVASFLPLNKLRTRPIPAKIRSLKGDGIHGLAIDLVEYDKKYEKAFNHVLGSTLVVEDVKTARRVGVGKTRMVTTSGDLIGSSGSMTGGYRKRKSDGAAFQEKELTSKIKELEGEIADYEGIIQRLSQEQEELSSTIEEKRKERHELENEVLALERELHIDSEDVEANKEDKERLRDEAAELEARIDDVVGEISTKNKELAQLKMKKQELRDKISELRSPEMLAELSTFEQQKQELSEEIVEIRTEAQGLKNQIESVHQPELDNINKILEEQEGEREEFLQEQEDLEAEVSEMKETLEEKEEREEEFRKQFKELFDRRNELQEAIEEVEEDVIAHEEKVRKAEHDKNAASVQKASLKAELAGLNEEYAEYEDVEPYEDKEDGEIKREIKEFERMVDDLGAVNMKALEMYEHVQHEYDELVEKKETLQKEREDVLLMINEIDAKKREMFMKTFDAIEEHFKEIFQSLSRKGEAFLELEEPDDPFAGGLEIRVRLTGNKFMDIRSLSGGEKTMTALAFLFAIQEYQPASFYVLDEVDAALDKKNSERLVDLIQKYCEAAQYVIISHNDTVISAADKLYGVSMDEHGKSQITSLEV